MSHLRVSKFPYHLSSSILFLVLLLLVPNCGKKITQSETDIDLAQFITMAREFGCDEIKNRLFLIDKTRVFWDREGNCADAGFAQILFGSTVDSVLCEFYESIGGHNLFYHDEQYSDMFDTIIANLDKSGLGLGVTHRVERIRF